MKGRKFILKSKTIIGALAALSTVFLPFVGLSFSESDQQLFSAATDQAIVLAGTVVSIYGRFKAVDSIRVSPNVK
jgi:hypothetical protein